VAALVDVVNHAKRHPAARVLAARELLDRGWGKAVQPLDVPEGAMISMSMIQAAAARVTATFESPLGPDPARDVTPRDAIYELLSEPASLPPDTGDAG
jgi:hypothetical protein